MKTTVNIRKVFESESKIKAIASVILDDQFVVHGVKLIETERGRFIAMPSETWQNAQKESFRRDVFHPIIQDAREQLETAVFAAYDEYLAGSQAESGNPNKNKK